MEQLFLQYPEELRIRVIENIKNGKAENYLKDRYREKHNITSNKQLFRYVDDIKRQYFKKISPIKRVAYDPNIELLEGSLGIYRNRKMVHGKHFRNSYDIRIASTLKEVPEQFLKAVVVHEIAHFKEIDHNKSFYALCLRVMPEYHQVEFDIRIYLAIKDSLGREIWV